MNTLTPEQIAEFVAEAARIKTAARAQIEISKELGLDAKQALAALTSAFTAIIAQNWPAAERLGIMNEMLGETITEWAGSPPAGVTVQ